MYRIYAGPKQEQTLEALGAGLIRAINLGYTWVVPLTRFFHWLLQALYSVIPNYGVAIILLTLGVRMVTAPLTTRQMRSMERMRALAPKLEELKAKFADDKAKQSEEMMKLYRQEGVNPLGGCLPMVLQIPVFIGLFYALQSSIELRHSPFFGWITDLSVPESLFTIPGLEIPVRVLPLLMGASMVVQQKLTPMQADPAQAQHDDGRDARDDDGDVLSIPVRTRALLDGEQRDRHLQPTLGGSALACEGVESNPRRDPGGSHVRCDE